MGDHKAAEVRKARLAEALRENVRRRKAQARKRNPSPPQDESAGGEGKKPALMVKERPANEA